MIPEVLVFAQVATIVVMLVGSLAGISTFLMHAHHRIKSSPALPHPTNEQLVQLQQSVDAIAVEVERIAEAQRFSVRLLAERGDVVPGGANQG